MSCRKNSPEEFLTSRQRWPEGWHPRMDTIKIPLAECTRSAKCVGRGGRVCFLLVTLTSHSAVVKRFFAQAKKSDSLRSEAGAKAFDFAFNCFLATHCLVASAAPSPQPLSRRERGFVEPHMIKTDTETQACKSARYDPTYNGGAHQYRSSGFDNHRSG